MNDTNDLYERNEYRDYLVFKSGEEYKRNTTVSVARQVMQFIRMYVEAECDGHRHAVY